MIAAADNPNLAILELAVRALGELTDSLVFVGGCATGLLVTKTRANQIRATEDVDVVTQVATIGEYHRVETMLAARGFKHDTSAGRANLPLAEQRNYARPHAVATRCPELPQSLVSSRHRYRQPSDASERPFDTAHHCPSFVATKLQAFKGRGNGDFLVSHDLEDIITVVDGRPALIDELRGAPEELRTYIATEISSLLGTPQFLDALPGHLPGDSASQSRVPLVINMLEALAR